MSSLSASALALPLPLVHQTAGQVNSTHVVQLQLGFHVDAPAFVEVPGKLVEDRPRAAP